MEAKSDELATSNDGKVLNLCEECKINPSKYKCPGCSLRSCSLHCVNSHKQRTGCTGKRSLSAFVPMSEFDDKVLLSDYNMLEDVKRIADSARRTRFKLCGYSHFRLPRPLSSLQNAAGLRRTKLLLLSNGMSKRQTNKTYYNYRKKFIMWSIEWRFHSTDVVLVDHGVNENSTLSSVIEKHLEPGPWNHPLRQFSDQPLDSLRFFIRKYPKGPKSPYCLLNIKAPIREQLANITILEFPVIHVFLPSHSCDFDIINVPKPRKAETEKPPQNNYPSPGGVTFKVEEIEDGEYLDPRVLDLMNHSHENGKTEDVIEEAPQSPCVVDMSSNSCFEQLSDIADLEFVFEPGLIDTHPGLIIDTNSSECLDFNGMVMEQEDLDCGEYLVEEELEEGEIAS